MEPTSAQLAAAVLALINTLVARQGSPGALVALAQRFSFARWGLEGYVISESNRLTGVWLLARCGQVAAASGRSSSGGSTGPATPPMVLGAVIWAPHITHHPTFTLAAAALTCRGCHTTCAASCPAWARWWASAWPSGLRRWPACCTPRARARAEGLQSNGVARLGQFFRGSALAPTTIRMIAAAPLTALLS